MSNQDIILNIAVNLGRLGRWADEKKTTRIPQFILDTQMYVDMLEIKKINSRLAPTIKEFLVVFKKFKTSNSRSGGF